MATTPTSTHRSHLPFLLMLLIFCTVFSVRAYLVFAIPTGGTVFARHLQGLNDEPAHFNYTKTLAATHRFPVLINAVKSPGWLIRNDWEYYQPPLYYLCCTPFYWLLSEQGALFAGRIISFFCGIATLFLMVGLLKKAGVDRFVQWGAFLVIGLLPTHAYFCALFSNDALSWLFAMLITYEFVVISQGVSRGEILTRTNIIRLIIYLSLGILIKSSLVLFLPLLCGLAGWGYSRTKQSKILLQCMGVCAAAFLLTLPWHLRNYNLYHSFLAVDVANGRPEHNLLSAVTFFEFCKSSIKNFWFPMGVTRCGTLFKILGLIGTFLLAGTAIMNVLYFSLKKRAAAQWWLIIIFAVVAVSYVAYNLQWGNSEGRFFLPALAAIAFGFVAVPYLLLDKLHCKIPLYLIWLGILTTYPYLYFLLM